MGFSAGEQITTPGPLQAGGPLCAFYHTRLTVQQFAAAKYYRLAEKNGNKIIGNSW